MAAQSNTGFPYEEALGSVWNLPAISSQLGVMYSTPEMIPVGNYFGLGSTKGMMLQGTPSFVDYSIGMVQAGNYPNSLLLDSAPDFTPDSDFSVEWSPDEQYRLEEGLTKYADEPGMMKYIKISSMFPDKTVRDIALRCKWITRKRREIEEYNAAKKANTMKGKLVELSSITSSSIGQMNFSMHSLLMHHMNQNVRVPYEVPGISSMINNLLEENAQAIIQIKANLSTYKLQDNVNLFCLTWNNISSLLNNMRNMPGIMSQMPPLPVSIDEDLANNFLSNITQSMFLGSSNGVHMEL